MTRVSPTDALARMPDEGIGKLFRLREPRVVYRKHLPREWGDVAKSLRQVLFDLACGRKPWPLYLWGPVQFGKTRAVLAFCDRTRHARYWTVGNVMDDMAMGRAPWYGFQTDLAVLDELGLPRIGEKGRDFDYGAVMEFYDWRECRPAIYVSNHSPKDIARLYDERIQQRLTKGTVYELVDRYRRRR